MKQPFCRITLHSKVTSGTVFDVICWVAVFLVLSSLASAVCYNIGHASGEIKGRAVKETSAKDQSHAEQINLLVKSLQIGREAACSLVPTQSTAQFEIVGVKQPSDRTVSVIGNLNYQNDHGIVLTEKLMILMIKPLSSPLYLPTQGLFLTDKELHNPQLASKVFSEDLAQALIDINLAYSNLRKAEGLDNGEVSSLDDWKRAVLVVNSQSRTK